ncbi:MAG: TIGR04282 family arsenosugar biosynthesis glycosyltransferase [Candidatus Deferrimicrobium sp.]
MEEAVVLMAKAPVPGRVKTRLCPPLAPAEAARLYACMLGDAAEEISSVGRIARYLFLDRPVAANAMRGAPFSSFERFPQRGKDLGEKMWDAAATAFRLGSIRVVIVGGDCPAYAAERLRSAFRELREGAEAVFGPSADGGYYLVGLACPDERLFRKFTWSTPTVLLDTVARCRALSIPFSFLSPERDVDTGKDLHALGEWARTHARPACPRTRGWITGFFGPGGGGFPGSRERTPGPPRGSRSRRGG